MTPVAQQPLAFGVDAVIHSATKYLDGQGRVVGGAVLGSRALIREQVLPVLRTTGPSLSAFNAWVLLKGLEGAVQWSAHRMGAAYADPEPARTVVRRTATSDFAGGMLLGVHGVTVIGHGAGTADEVCACVRLADRAARMGLVSSTQSALAGVVRS